MKNLFLIIFYISCFVCGQVKSGYIDFYQDENNIFSCDSSSIKRINNIITCRIVLKPTNESNRKNYFIRQYLLNSFLNKYYVLGEIEYDSTMKIITTNNPKIVNPTEAKSIGQDTVIYSLAKYLNQHLNEQIFFVNFSPQKEILSLVEPENQLNPVPENPSQNQNIISDENNIVLEIPPVNYIETNKIIEDNVEPGLKIANHEEVLTYKYENEFNVEGTIFSDGALYCYQISSWKNKSVAEKEVQKLINKGFNAFLMQAQIGNKKTIWYRVRVGYFNSKDEALKNQKKAKNL